MSKKQAATFIATARLNDFDVILAFGAVSASPDVVGQHAMDAIYESGLEDDVKDELRRSLRVQTTSSFILELEARS